MASNIPILMSFSIVSYNTIVLSIVFFIYFCDIPLTSAQRYSDNHYEYSHSNNNHETYGGGEYLSDWSNSEWGKLSGRIQQPKCIDIPSNLTLCHGIGYQKMMLPNLLDHDSMSEVTQQAASWVPLTRINCHPDAKVFLCSLFSPVCLDRLIYPCRSLCEGVQASCVGRMKTYGFDWPDMLKCDKFPFDNDMCIKLIHDIKPDNSCMACKHPLTHESLIDQFCRSDVAMRVSMKEFKDVNGHKELVLRKKKTLFKHEKLSKAQVRSLNPIIEGGASCRCESINSTKERYLLMGNKRGEKLVVSFGIVWNRKDREFKKGITAIRKGNTCEGIIKELSANGADSKPVLPDKNETTKKMSENKVTKSDQKSKTDLTDKKTKGTKGKKGKKGNKDKKGKGKKKIETKQQTTPNTTKRRNGVAKSGSEDRTSNNFMRAAN